jgi:uncharacterized protein YndB with AHSA1/START domain
MKSSQPVIVRVSHTFAASPERVFDAWLDPSRLGKWMFATPGGEMVHVSVEPRVGGCFNVTERREGEDVEHIGEFVEIDRPRRLVFLFQVPKYGPTRDRVEVDITPLGTGCTVTITHELAPADAEMKDGVIKGWTEILAGLDRVTAERS